MTTKPNNMAAAEICWLKAWTATELGTNKVGLLEAKLSIGLLVGDSDEDSKSGVAVVGDDDNVGEKVPQGE